MGRPRGMTQHACLNSHKASEQVEKSFCVKEEQAIKPERGWVPDRSDGYVSSRSFPTFQGTGKSNTPPGSQRHPHSSTIMSLWWSRRTLPLSTYSMLSGLVLTGAQQVEGTRWGWYRFSRLCEREERGQFTRQ